MSYCCVFFFFKQKTAYEMRISDWSSDVCSSDLLVGFAGMSVALIDTGDGLVLVDGALPQAAPAILVNVRKLGFDPKDIKFILSTEPHFDHAGGLAALARDTGAMEIGRAACRERVCQYV